MTVLSSHCLDFPTMIDDTWDLVAKVKPFSPKLLFFQRYFSLSKKKMTLDQLSLNVLISL